MRSRFAGAWLALVGGVAASAWGQNTLYVDTHLSGGNGLSWDTAMAKLEQALAVAATNPNVRTIKVAHGNYYPTGGRDRTRSFVIRPGLTVVGGFAGVTINPSEPEQLYGATLLSGDIGAVGTREDNSYHVVRMNPDPRLTPTLLQRVSIAHGFADGRGDDSSGAGLFVDRARLTLNEVSISETRASGPGGGVYARKAVLDMSGGPVVGSAGQLWNNVAQHGGAVYADGGVVKVMGYDCTKNGLTTTAGNGRDIAFVGEMQKGSGAWGIYDSSHPGEPSGSINKGGCIYIATSPGAAPIDLGRYGDLYNVFRNRATRYGGGVWVESGTARIAYSIFWLGYWSYEPSDLTLEGGGLGVNTGAKVYAATCFFDSNVVFEGGRGSAIFVRPGGSLWLAGSVVHRAQTWDDFPPVRPAIEVDGTAELYHCTIVRNQFGGLSVRGSASVYNSIAWGNDEFQFDGNVSAKYCDVQGGWPGLGNVDLNPCFESFDGGSYALRYISQIKDLGEPGIPADWCDVDADLSTAETLPWDHANLLGGPGFPRQFGPSVDMGAYESQRCHADATGDGVVDENDESLYLFWFGQGWNQADMDCDDSVTIEDFLIFAEHYSAGC